MIEFNHRGELLETDVVEIGPMRPSGVKIMLLCSCAHR